MSRLLAEKYLEDCKKAGHPLKKTTWAKSHDYCARTLYYGLAKLKIKDVNLAMGGDPSKVTHRGPDGKFVSKEMIKELNPKGKFTSKEIIKELNPKGKFEINPRFEKGNTKTTSDLNYFDEELIQKIITQFAGDYGKIDNQSIFFRNIVLKFNKDAHRRYVINGVFALKQNGEIITMTKNRGEKQYGDLEKTLTDGIINQYLMRGEI